jgi:RimJ/RimL family protein N-acetyltransferase
MMYQVRTAEEKDLIRILEIYAYAREFMAKTGNPNQWGKTNPPRETLEKDIEERKLHVVEDGNGVCGVFFFFEGPDPTYQEIYEGEWISDTPYGTIHRIASCGRGGVFESCLAYCLGFTRHLRIDTHRDNFPMQKAVEKNGFAYRGIIHLLNGDERLAYEKA